MRGELYIDGHDAYLDHGIFVEIGDLGAVVQMPPFKALDKTDWPEEDGEEYDLTAPVLDSRTVQLKFCITNVDIAEDLFYVLSDGSYHTFEFTRLQRTYRWRLSQNGAFNALRRLGKLTLTFVEDQPQLPAISQLPALKSIRYQGCEIDGMDVGQFGLSVLQGTRENVYRAANVKDVLKVSSKTVAGVIADSASPMFKSRDVTLKLHIRTESISQFWQRYEALFSRLFQSQLRRFYFTETDAEYECFYKSSSVQKLRFLSGGGVWCEFSVVLTITNYRPFDRYKLLATEDFNYVVTEDGNYIKLRPKFGISLLIDQEGRFITLEDGETLVYFNNIK